MQIKTDQLHTAIWIYDIDKFSIVWANPAALKLWDSPNFEELSQRNFEADQSDALKEMLQ